MPDGSTWIQVVFVKVHHPRYLEWSSVALDHLLHSLNVVLSEMLICIHVNHIAFLSAENSLIRFWFCSDLMHHQIIFTQKIAAHWMFFFSFFGPFFLNPRDGCAWKSQYQQIRYSDTQISRSGTSSHVKFKSHECHLFRVYVPKCVEFLLCDFAD